MTKESEPNRPQNCVNCKSENILGPYSNHNTLINVGWRVLNQNLFVCADCGYSMQFTIKKHKQTLIDKEERKRGERRKN